MTDLDGMMYMSSTSDFSGTLQLTLSSKNGTDPDIAQVQVQNKLQAAPPLQHWHDTSDDWGSYDWEETKEKLLTGKIITLLIERNNLKLHTRMKRLAR